MSIAFNSLGVLRAAQAQVQVGNWVTAGGAASLSDLGGLRGIKVEGGNKINMVKVDNNLWAIDAYLSELDLGIGITMVEADLKHFNRALGGVDAGVTVSAGVSMTIPLDSPSAVNFWQVVITVAGLGIKIGADTYTKAIYTFYRTIFEAKVSEELSVTKEVVIAGTFKCVWDSTVTQSSTVGHVGKVVLSVS